MIGYSDEELLEAELEPVIGYSDEELLEAELAEQEAPCS